MDTLLSLLLNELTGMLMEQLQPIISVGAAVAAILCLAFCFWGYKLSKVLFAVLCFLLGLLLGVAIVMGTDHPSVGVGLLLGAACGAGLAYLSKYIYKALVFLSNAGLVVLLFTLMANDETIGFMVTLGIVLGAVAGFFAVKYIRFSLILFTSLFYGLSAGTAILLVVGLPNPGIGLLAGAILVAFGFHYQWKTTGGGTFKNYFLLRKTEAEREKQTVRADKVPLSHVATSPMAAVKGSVTPDDLFGVSIFSRVKGYAAIPFAAVVVLSLLPIRGLWPAMILSAILMCLEVGVGIYLSPCIAMGMVLCNSLFSILRFSAYPAYLSGLAATVLFVFLVSVGCRRFPGVVAHIFIFAGAGILSELLLLPTLRYDIFLQLNPLSHLISGLCAAAFEEFAMPAIIKHLPDRLKVWFQVEGRAASKAVAPPAPVLVTTDTENMTNKEKVE